MSRLTRRLFLTVAPALLQGAVSGGGSRVDSPRSAILDPLTERKMQRLSDPRALHHLPHSHHNFLDRGNDFLIVGSEISGSRQIHLLDFKKEEMVQLTSGSGVEPYSATLDSKSRDVYFVQSDRLKVVSARGRGEKTLYSCEPGWNLTGHITVSSDERYVAAVEMRAGQAKDDFHEQFDRHPRCRLRGLELGKRARGWVIVESDDWLSRPQFRPGGDEILYAHEGPWERVNGRLRLTTLDGRLRTNLRPRESAEQIGSEYWTQDGQTICYVFFPDDSGRGATVRGLHFLSRQETVISRCSAFGWMQGNRDNSAIVGASRRLSGPNIYVLFTSIKREITLAEHMCSLKPYPIAGTSRLDPYASHPSPAISANSQWVYFVSDREGLPAIYRMDISDLVEET